MKLIPHSVRWNGERLRHNEFAFVQISRDDISAIVFWCPNGKNRMCSIPITRGDQIEEQANRKWHWDGNEDEPTITPSIGCDAPPRCGWHGNITKGETKP